MKVLLLNGSPHNDGNTYISLNEMYKVFNQNNIETEIFNIGKDEIKSCQVCYACAKLHKCVINDKVNQFLEKAKTADGFVFGSPVHYGNLTGQIMTFLTRCFFADSFANTNIFRNKPVTSIAICRRAGAISTLDELNKFCFLAEMPIISGRYWNIVYGQKLGEVLQDKEGMQNLRILTNNMSYYLKCQEIAKQNGILPPKKEEVEFTNFIKN